MTAIDILLDRTRRHAVDFLDGLDQRPVRHDIRGAIRQHYRTEIPVHSGDHQLAMGKRQKRNSSAPSN